MIRADDELIDPSVIGSLIQIDETLELGIPPVDSGFCFSDSQQAKFDLGRRGLECLHEAFGKRTPPRELPVGMPDVMGHFAVQSVVGSGGMAVVYRARDQLLDRPVALKIPRPHTLVSDTLRKRFICEAHAAAQLDHPHVVATYEAGEAGGIPYIAYAFCPGPTLAHWMNQRRLPLDVRRSARLVCELAGAVEYSHRRGILHRDLKPANVLLFPQDESADSVFPFVAKISDFGLAKLTEGDWNDTASSMMLGTPRYMSPEQANGRHDLIGPATDVYGLGMILYELLTGVTPFNAATLEETLRLVRDQTPIAPRRINPAIPRDLDTITRKCLHKQPADRYATARELLLDLQRFQNHQPIQARPISPLTTGWRWCRRHPVLTGLSASVLILAISILAQSLRHTSESQTLQDEIQTRNTRLTQTVQQLDAALTLSNRLRNQAEVQSSENRDLLYVSRIQHAAQAWRRHDPRQVLQELDACVQGQPDGRPSEFAFGYLEAQSTARQRTFSSSQSPFWNVTYSTDGKYLACAGSDGTVRIHDAESGALLRQLVTHHGEVNSAEFSADNQWLATAGDDGTVGVWNVASGQLLHSLNVFPQAKVYGVKFLPHQELLVACGKSPQLRVFHWRKNEVAFELSGGHHDDIEAIDISPDGSMLASAGFDGTTITWDFNQRRIKLKLVTDHHLGRTLAVKLFPQRNVLLTGGMDRLIHVWRLDDGHALCNLPMREPVQSIAISGTGQVIGGDRSGALGVWNLLPNESDFQLDAVWEAHRGRIHSVAVSPISGHLATTGSDGEVREWNVQFQPHSISIGPIVGIPFAGAVITTAVALDPASKQVVRASSDSVQLWDAVSGKQVWERSLESTGQDPEVPHCADLRDRTIMLGTRRGNVIVLRVDQPDTPSWSIPVFPGSIINQVLLFPDGRHAAAVCDSYGIQVIDLVDRTVTHPVKDADMIALSSDGKQLAAVEQSGQIALYDTSNWSLHRFARTQRETLTSVGFLPGNRRLLTGSEDRTAMIHSLLDWSHGPVLQTDGIVLRVACSPDGRTIATGTVDGQIMLWHAATGLELFALDQLPGYISGLQFSHDSRLLMAATSDRNVHVFLAYPAHDQ